jgi:YbbR domain-containing protein
MMERICTLSGKKFLAKTVENWPAKVLSIALAIVFFTFHRLSSLEDRFFSVPLNIEMNENLVAASSYTRMIRVSLRGDKSIIDPILEDDIEVYADLTKYTEPGSFRAPVQIRKNGTAQGVDSLEITVDPMEISLVLDKKVSKYVPLSPNYDGNLAAGYELSSYILSPTQILIEGPLHVMSGITELYTDIIELSGRNLDFAVLVRILNRDPLIVIRGDGVTEFRGFVTKSQMSRTIENLPIRLRGTPEDLVAGSSIVQGTITIEGSQNELESYVPEDELLMVNLAGIERAGTYTMPVKVNLPKEYTLIRSYPAEVKVEVRSLIDTDREQ